MQSVVCKVLEAAQIVLEIGVASENGGSERNRGVYEMPDLSLEEILTRAIDGYQPGGSHGADIGNTTPGFIPATRHDDQGPGGYEPGREHDADIGNSTPGFTPMHNNATTMERNKHRSGSADKNRQKNIDKGIPESRLGPSGEPKIHKTMNPNKKRAEDRATDRGPAPILVKRYQISN